jgi:hypothetical protein
VPRQAKWQGFCNIVLTQPRTANDGRITTLIFLFSGNMPSITVKFRSGRDEIFPLDNLDNLAEELEERIIEFRAPDGTRTFVFTRAMEYVRITPLQEKGADSVVKLPPGEDQAL